MTGGTGLRVTGLRKAFDGPDVLHDVNLSVAAGELVAILGASGSGKTTLLRLVCGFERVDAGEVALGGRMVAGPGLHVATEHRRVGYVAQEGALFPHLSVGENVLFGLPRRDRRDHRRARTLLQQVGLPAAYADRGPHQLSGGEQQRVALARALAPAPRLVLLDEPFSALDAALRVETRRAVAASLAAAGATAVLVTHDQAEALSLGQRVAVLRRGAIVQFDTPDALYRNPADLDVARFVGDAVLVPGQACGSQAQCCLGALPLAAPAHGAVTVMVRPEQVRLGDGGAPARVDTVLFHGPDAAVGLLLAGGEAVTARVAGHAVPAIGCQLHVAVEGPVIAFAPDGDGLNAPPPVKPSRTASAQ